MSEFRQQLCDYVIIDKCENSAQNLKTSNQYRLGEPAKGNAKMEKQTNAVAAAAAAAAAPVGIPASIKPATAAAYAAMQIAVLGLAKAGSKVSTAVKAAKAAAMVDPLYLTGEAKVNGKVTKMADFRAIAVALVGILSDVHATAQAGAVKASTAKKFADPKERAAFERAQMKPVLDAIQYAKNHVIDLVGGAQQSRITYDGKAKAYAITAAPDPGKAPTSGKGKGKGKSPDAGKGKSPDAGKGKSPTVQAQELATSAIDGAPGIMVAMLRDGILSRSLRVSFGENPDAERVAIIAGAMELEAAVTALQPRKSK